MPSRLKSIPRSGGKRTPDCLPGEAVSYRGKKHVIVHVTPNCLWLVRHANGMPEKDLWQAKATGIYPVVRLSRVVKSVHHLRLNLPRILEAMGGPPTESEVRACFSASSAVSPAVG